MIAADMGARANVGKETTWTSTQTTLPALNVLKRICSVFEGKLYANFDTAQLDLTNGPETAVIPAALYQIDPITGATAMIGPTDIGLLTVMNDRIYAFDAPQP